MTPSPGVGGGLARHRSWLVAAVLIAAVIAAALATGRHGHSLSGARPRVSFGSDVQPPSASGRNLESTNGWVASAGDQSVAVFAGSQTRNRHNGLLVIQRRTSRAAGASSTSTRILHATGPVTLLRPATPQSEAAAFQETLHFVTASGATGTIALPAGRVSLNR